MACRKAATWSYGSPEPSYFFTSFWRADGLILLVYSSLCLRGGFLILYLIGLKGVMAGTYPAALPTSGLAAYPLTGNGGMAGNIGPLAVVCSEAVGTAFSFGFQGCGPVSP